MILEVTSYQLMFLFQNYKTQFKFQRSGKVTRQTTMHVNNRKFKASFFKIELQKHVAFRSVNKLTA